VVRVLFREKSLVTINIFFPLHYTNLLDGINVQSRHCVQMRFLSTIEWELASSEQVNKTWSNWWKAPDSYWNNQCNSTLLFVNIFPGGTLSVHHISEHCWINVYASAANWKQIRPKTLASFVGYKGIQRSNGDPYADALKIARMLHSQLWRSWSVNFLACYGVSRLMLELFL